MFTCFPLGEVCWPRGREDAQNVVADAVYLVRSEDAKEAGDDGESRFVVRQKGARKCQGAGCEGREEEYGHAVVESLEEICDAAGRVGEGEDGTTLNGRGSVDGVDKVMEDLGVADEEALVHDEVVGPGEDDDVAVDEGEVGVSNELRVGHV